MGTSQISKKNLDILGIYREPRTKLTGGIKYETDPFVLDRMIVFFAKHNKPLRKIPVRAINRFAKKTDSK